MSLLLEALKKAEMVKRGNLPASSDKLPAVESGLTLEAPVATAITEVQPAGGNELSFPEITLAELAPREPPPTLPDTPQEEVLIEQPALAVPTEPPKFVSPDEASFPELTEAKEAPPLGMAEKTEPTLTLDIPEPPRQAASQANAPEPKIIEEEPAAPVAELRPPNSSPAAPEQPPAAIPAPAIPVPEYSPPQPHHAPAGTADSLSSEQKTAKKILSAKLVGTKRNLKLLGGILAVSMVAGATAAYFYWQAISQPGIAVQPHESLPPIAPPPAPQRPPAGAPQETAAEPPPVTATAPSAATTHSEPTVPAAEPQSIPAKPKAPPVGPIIPAKPKSAASDEPDKHSAMPLAGQNAVPTDSGIKIRREAGEIRLDPLLSSAYQAFMAGDSGKAEIDYRKVLQQTPNNRDALLGLAAIAASRGQADEAASHYLRLLQLDPRDAAAQASLIGLKGYSDPTLSESRLKGLLSQSSDAGYLHFALGNLYAQQSRWSEAQESYFNALHAEPGNTDYAFNLAVALDHLDQHKPALVYYQRALSLLKGRSAGFNRDQLNKRIHELQTK